MLEAKKLKLEEEELVLTAKKDGLKMAADRRTANAKIDLEVERMMQNTQNQTPKKES